MILSHLWPPERKKKRMTRVDKRTNSPLPATTAGTVAPDSTAGARCQCRHPKEWHGRHGCYAIAPSGACECKQYVPDLMDALRIGLGAL